jgi:guanine deaminase
VQAVDGLRRYGRTLTEHLAEIGFLGNDFVAAHGVWLSPDDIRLLAEHGSIVAHNPASNLKLGNGIAPVRQMLGAGMTVALGTDGSASSDHQNLFGAMHYAGSVSRIESPDPADWLSSREVLQMATRGGACACQLPVPGSIIEPGQPADVVLLRKTSPKLQPVNDLPSQLVFAEDGRAVDTVIVGGEVVLQGGRSTRVDEDRVYREAQAAIDRVRASNAAEWELARRMTPFVVAACSQLALVPYPIDRRLSDESRGS